MSREMLLSTSFADSDANRFDKVGLIDSSAISLEMRVVYGLADVFSFLDNALRDMLHLWIVVVCVLHCLQDVRSETAPWTRRRTSSSHPVYHKPAKQCAYMTCDSFHILYFAHSAVHMTSYYTC